MLPHLTARQRSDDVRWMEKEVATHSSSTRNVCESANTGRNLLVEPIGEAREDKMSDNLSKFVYLVRCDRLYTGHWAPVTEPGYENLFMASNQSCP